MSSSKIKVPSQGEKISYKNNQLVVPDNPIIPFIEGDGIGVDITPVMIDVVNAAVKSAYKGKREISWMEIYCGEKAVEVMERMSGCHKRLSMPAKNTTFRLKGHLLHPLGEE